MVATSSEHLDRIFHALAHPTRRRILAATARGGVSVGALADAGQHSFAAVAKHIQVLEDAGLLEKEWQGRTAMCRLNPDALREANEWIDAYRQFWTVRLDELEKLLRRKPRKRGGKS